MSQRSLEEFGAYRKAKELFDEIIGILTTTIERLRSPINPNPTQRVREEAIRYGT